METTEKKPMKVLPYSYSSLTSFETCAWKHWMIKVSKQVQDSTYAQAQEGIDIHSGAELLIKEGTPYNGKFAQRIVEAVEEQRAKPGATVQAEAQLAVTRTMQPVGWWDTEAHARGMLDMLVLGPDWAHISDWKTGKPNAYTLQLKHNAMLVMMHHPEVNKVTWSYEWLKAGYATKGALHREFIQQNWDQFEARVRVLERALRYTEEGMNPEAAWPKKPSGLCKAYCAVTSCQYNGQKK